MELQFNHNQRSRFLKLAAIAMGICLVTLSCKKDRNDDDDYIMSNQTFVTSASSSNNLEIAAGALAQTKGQNEQVKHYGEHMVTDHTAAAAQMKTLADQKGWTVLAPTEFTTKHRQNLDILIAASGTDFDKKFAQIMVESHQEAVNLFEAGGADRGVPDGDLRAMAAAKLPTLKAHLQDAINLKAAVNP
jgi:putative membrane protein